MSTTDGAIDQKLFYDLEWIYHILFSIIKSSFADETSSICKIVFIFLSQIKQHDQY